MKMIKMRQIYLYLTALIFIFGSCYLGWYYYKNSVNETKFLVVENGKFDLEKFSYVLNINNQSNSQMDLTVAEIPLSETNNFKKIYFYYDKDYPILGSSVSSVLGVYDHLLAEYQQKNISVEIQQVDANQLSEIMNDKNSVLIMATGILPETVYSPDKNLISPWLADGGTLFWVGDGFGYYYGVAGTEIKNQESPYKIGWSRQERLLGHNYLDGPNVGSVFESQGDVPSSLATTFGIKSRYTQAGVLVSSLAENGGLDLGYHYSFKNDSRTSLAEIKIGNGDIIIFGSPLLNREMDVAWDISQITSSGFLQSDVLKINFRKIIITSDDKEKIDRQIDIDNNTKVRLMIFSSDFAKRYFLLKDFARD